MAIEMTIPLVKWNKRAIPEGETDYEWVEESSQDLFEGKRVVLFSLPGAFTPTCSSQQLPGYEELYDEFKANGIDEVYCLSVNDAFVMNAWFKNQDIKKVKPIGDGEGVFTQGLDMLVDKPKQGFGKRSWRYSMLVDNGEIVKQEVVECADGRKAYDGPSYWELFAQFYYRDMFTPAYCRYYERPNHAYHKPGKVCLDKDGNWEVRK